MPRIPETSAAVKAGRAAAGAKPGCVPHNAVAVDAEWDESSGVRDKYWLTLQLHAPATGRTVVYTRADLPHGVKQALTEEARLRNVFLRFIDRGNDDNLLRSALPLLFPDKSPKEVDLLTFFSPKDIEYAVGWAEWSEALERGFITQHRALAGRFGRGPRIRLRDLSGWTDRGMGLAKLAASLGLDAGGKSLMDGYKQCMSKGLNEHPAEFLRYAVGDVLLLPRIYSSFLSYLNAILRDTLAVDEDGLFRSETIPMTTGRLVYEAFTSWQLSRTDDPAAWLICLAKLGYLNPTEDNYLEARERRCDILSRVRCRDDVQSLLDDLCDFYSLKCFTRDLYQYHAMSACGISWWSSRAKTESSLYNAIVQGGRCNNEMPNEYHTGPGLDIDLSSCYGTTLRSLTYPVGVPTVLSYKPNERRPTLGQFLKRWGRDLVDGLWQVIVSGRLPFEQDLVYSTIITPSRLAGAAERGDLAGCFALLRRETVNGIITANVYNTLLRVATNEERGALMQLEVVTAAFYRASDRRDADAWVDEILAAPDGGAAACLDPGERPDTRPTLWYGVDLEGFIGPLVEERKRLKERAKEGDSSAGPLDNVVKLLINTLYGDLASRHFEIGNTVVANNITARARVGVWMVAKALGLRQTVTDGGIYTPNRVPFWRYKKPGLAVLSRMWEWTNHRRGRTWKPLGGRDWVPGECPADADVIAKDHISSFWEPYGLELSFELSHKAENAFLKAAYWSKADYALLLPGGQPPVMKCRGKQKPRPGETAHPRATLLKNILNDGDDYPSETGYWKGEILKVGRYLQALWSNGYPWLKGLRPGDTVPPRHYHARENNLHMPLLTAADWKRRATRRKYRAKEPVEWFECWGDQGVGAVVRHMAADTLRRRRKTGD
jgi:hypothetical protein